MKMFRQSSASLPGEDQLDLKNRRPAGVLVKHRIPDHLKVWLDFDRGGQLQGIDRFHNISILVMDGLGRGRGLASDKTDAEKIVARPLQQEMV